MKSIFLFLFVFTLFNCSKNSEAITKFNDSISVARQDSLARLAKEDSIIEARKKRDYNSLINLNKERKYFGENLNLHLDEFLNMLHANIISCENIFEMNGWFFLSKNEYLLEDKVTNTDFMEQAIDRLRAGKHLTYRNQARDTEVLIFKGIKSSDKVKITTTNPYNYRQLISQLNERNFTSAEAGVLHDPQANFGIKNYIGELEIIESNGRIYSKGKYKILAFTYIKSPVTKVVKSTETLSGFSFMYDPTDTVTEYEFTITAE